MLITVGLLVSIMNRFNLSTRESLYLQKIVIVTQDVIHEERIIHKGSVGMVVNFGNYSGDPIVEFQYPYNEPLKFVISYEFLKFAT